MAISSGGGSYIPTHGRIVWRVITDVGSTTVTSTSSRPSPADVKRSILEMLELGMSAREVATNRDVLFDVVMMVLLDPEGTLICHRCLGTGAEEPTETCGYCRGDGAAVVNELP